MHRIARCVSAYTLCRHAAQAKRREGRYAERAAGLLFCLALFRAPRVARERAAQRQRRAAGIGLRWWLFDMPVTPRHTMPVAAASVLTPARTIQSMPACFAPCHGVATAALCS